MIMEEHACDNANYQYKESFNLLFNQIEDCLLIFDPAGRIIQVNKALLEKLDYSKEEMISMNFEHLLRRRTAVQELVKGILKGKISKCLLPFCSKSRQLISLEIHVFKGKWEGNDVFYGIGKEVLKVRESDQKLKNIQSILNSLPFIFWMKDKDGKYIIVNRSFEDFYGIKNKEIVGKTDFDIFPYNVALEHKNNEEELIKSKKRLLNHPHNHKVYGKWLETFVMRYYEDGIVAGTLGVSRNIIKRKKLEMELANQEKFLKTILDTIPDYIFYKDINRKYLGCNKAIAEKFFGLKENEIKGKTDFELLKDTKYYKYSKFHRQKDRDVLTSGKTLKYEDRYVLKDGSIINTETITAPFINEQGKVAGLIGIARDITDRKNLERLLREKVKYAELLFRTVPSAVVSLDKHQKIFRWNKIAEKITGYSAEEVIGKDCSGVLQGVDMGNCKVCLNVADSPLINQNCQIKSKYGEIHHILRSIAVIKDEFGEISEIMSCFGDITEMVNMREELRESKERYAAIVNSAPQIVLIIKEGIIKFMNDAGIEVLGYKDERIGHPIKEILTENSYVRLNSALLEVKKEENCITCELELIKKSGEIINVLLKGTEIAFEREKAFLAVMMDITERKKLDAKLRESEEKFRQLAETINEIFLITNKDKIVYVSPAYERISGMSCQSLLDCQSSLIELMHPVDRERMRASIFRDFYNMDENVNEEFRIIRPDGETRWLWLQSYPIRDNANNSSLLKAINIVDITDRKKIEDQLRKREHQTRMELLLAARVQQNFLPDPFSGDKMRMETIFEPHSTVSGDIFNFKWFNEQEKLCGYIIDVSGHGVATALQTATFKMMFDNVLLSGKKIEEDDIKSINEKIIPYLYEGSFIALLYFEFDFQAAILKLISAGITLFLAANPQECSLVPISGCYLGIIDDPAIEMTTIPLKEGEIYCLMSDGASDLIELYGISKHENLTEYMNWLEKLSICPECNDDFTVIGIEILARDKEINVLHIKNEEDLENTQVMISEFLERNASVDAPMLEVAINEAINNALNACGQASVKTRRVGNKLIVRVKDDGPGFNTEKIKALLKKDGYEQEFDELLESENGRGILIIKMLFDKVIYNAKGNEVLMMKEL